MVALLAAASACGRSGLYGDDLGDDALAAICADDPEECSSIATLERAADILFVIDNSGSMGEEQGKLAANFADFIEVIEDRQVGASYRIGITTTDRMGLRASSCRERLGEFERSVILNSQHFNVNSVQAGCLDACRLPYFQTEPTSLVRDGEALPRPWLEKSSGASNLPPGVGMTDALQCVGPQGIDGDGFEEPLESMLTVLTDEVTGFVRDDALLAVIFVTDEVDCSMPPEHRNRAVEALPLRTDVNRGATSGVCWRAGVECIGGPGTYETCFAQDFDFQRQPTSTEPVLYPVTRYVDLLREIGNEKERRGGNGTVLVAVIAGVPEDYPERGELVFRDSDFPDFNVEYGIGPGCGRGRETLPDPPGIPPVRLREFAEAFETEGRNIFSICSNDYTAALRQIANAIGELGTRSCVPGCVTDGNPNVSGLQPSCRVIEKRHPDDGGDRAVEPCGLTNDGWFFPSPTSALCYRALWDDRTLTPPIDDDITPQCKTRGSNLEVVVERRPGAPVAAGSGVRVDCDLVDPVAAALGREGACMPS